MAEEKKTVARKKPKFLRVDSHKKIRLGKGVKKNQKWHSAIGRHNKIRLGRKGRIQRPKVGWGTKGDVKGFIGGVEATQIENLKELAAVQKGVGVIVGKVGAKKRLTILEKAKEMGVNVLNRYKKEAKA
ncbi:MAG: eL32 family ribosomal protein [archaeon]